MKNLKINIGHFNQHLRNISRFNRYLILFILSLFSCIFYLSIPALYNFESLQKQLEIKLLDDFKLNISLSENIKYNLLPSPSFEIANSSLYLESKNKLNELGQLKKFKIYISARSLYKQEEIKIKRIVFEESIFDFNEKSWKFISNYFQNEILNKKIIIKKSKIFLKKNLDNGALAILTIDNSNSFYNYKKNMNILKAKGRVFNTPFIFTWKNDFNNIGNTKFILKFNEMNISLKNNLEKKVINNKNKYNGNHILNFMGSEIKVNYNFDDKIAKFETIKSKVNNDDIFINGKINLQPFFFKVNFDLKKMNLFKIFNQEYLINGLINNDIFKHNNFNGDLIINIDKLSKSKIFDFAQINIKFKNGKINFNTTELISKKFGKLKLLDSQLIHTNEYNLIRIKAELHITDQEKFYQRFQVSQNLRKPINKVFFEFDKNTNSDELKLYKIEIYNNDKKYLADFDFFLKNINNEFKINSIYDLNKFFKEVFKQIN